MRTLVQVGLVTVCVWRFLACNREGRWTFMYLWGILGTLNLALLVWDTLTTYG